MWVKVGVCLNCVLCLKVVTYLQGVIFVEGVICVECAIWVQDAGFLLVQIHYSMSFTIQWYFSFSVRIASTCRLPA